MTSPYADRTDREQRQHVLSVLDPRRTITYKHLDRAVGLAVHHEWNLEGISDRELATAYLETRTIKTTPIYGDVELAIFCHEGGHLEAPVADRTSMESEFAAWRWAMNAIGHRWNGAMAREMEACLKSYHPLRVKTYPDLLAMQGVIAEGHEFAKHTVRIIR
jgi:hypothetical protein